jgi:acetylornithine/N-succinyldiaminopimelate aminotransferase
MNLIDLEKKYFLPVFKRNPVVLVKGKGQYLWDEQGKRYLDFFSGLGVNLFGHGHPKIVKTVEKQSRNLIHTCNLYYTKPQILLAKKLIELSFPGKVFFSNSGAEANECAIKLARKYGEVAKSEEQRAKRYEIIVFEDSFHGRTLATLTATGQKKFHQGFEPLVPGFKYAKFNDLDSVKRLVGPKTGAIMVELIQGEGGVIVAKKEFIQGLKKIAQKYDLLLIFDEIQTGLGRTGKIFAYEHYGVEPDILTLAKGLAGGLPLGTTITNQKIANVFAYGDHGSTFGGNLVACSASLEVLKLLNPKLLSQVREVGKYFHQNLKNLQKKYSFIKEVRGIGLMLALELDFPGAKIVSACLEKGLLVNCTQEKVVRFLPPLIINKKDVDQAMTILEQVFKKI